MKKTNILISFLIVAVFILGGLIYFSDKKVGVGEIENNSEAKNVYTVDLGNSPIEFDLPKGYGVYTSGGYEGGYEFTVRIGKVSRDNYLSEAVPTIYIRDFVPQTNGVKFYKPSEYIDVVFSTGPDSGNLEPKLITLFGNKAVRTITDADGHPIIVGYLRGDQLPDSFGGKEYSVTVSGATYGTGKEFNQELFDLVVNSLRIKSK